ncbi:MAG: hypothetical protein MUP17_06725 [candidate division Zixibacteria bacterium]|nr:hypothetical protein [candidate division Zixibacteria bacterium]
MFKIFKILAKLLILFVVLLLLLINSLWGLFAFFGFSIGLLIYTLLVYIRSHSHKQYIRRLYISIIFFVSVIFILLVRLQFQEMLYLRYPHLRVIENITYLGRIIYFSDSDLWEINEEIQIDEKLVETLIKEISTSYLSKQRVLLTGDSIFLLKGWNSSGVIDGKLRFTKQRKQLALSRWFPFYKTDSIFIPTIKFLHLFLIPDDESRVTFDVPHDMIAITYPCYSSRVDLLKDNKEQLTIPINDASESGVTIRIKVLSPLLRNKVGKTLIKASIWSPIKWIILALCAIFAEQIKKGILIPLVRSIFRVFRIPYMEDKKDKTDLTESSVT